MENKENKPGNSAFKQQKLTSWNFTLSKKSLALIYIVSGCLWIMIGLIIILESNNVIEHTLQYNNKTGCSANWQHPQPCTLELKITEKMNSPIFIYYQIENMYQVHRKYVKNRDINQLMGKEVTSDDLKSKCVNSATMEELGIFTSNQLLSPKSKASPCGIFARSYFNDTFEIFPGDSNKKPVKIETDGISWSFEKEEKFKNHDREKMWTSVENSKKKIDHFINWMSPAPLSTFRKLWGKVEDDIEEGTYFVVIHNNYDVSGFEGSKSLVLTTSSSLGGKMVFLGVIGLGIGVLSLVFGLGIFAMVIRSRRQGIKF